MTGSIIVSKLSQFLKEYTGGFLFFVGLRCIWGGELFHFYSSVSLSSHSVFPQFLIPFSLPSVSKRISPHPCQASPLSGASSLTRVGHNFAHSGQTRHSSVEYVSGPQTRS